jgi:hypothetical protein
MHRPTPKHKVAVQIGALARPTCCAALTVIAAARGLFRTLTDHPVWLGSATRLTDRWPSTSIVIPVEAT